MSITPLSTDLNIIAALADKPNATDGLDASQLKAKFDEGPNALKSYINGTLVPAINANMGHDLSRQAIINGNFDVEPLRGSSFTNPPAGSYMLDRWSLDYTTGGGTLPTTITHTRRQLTSGELAKSAYCYRISVDGAGSGFGSTAEYAVRQKIENGARYLCGEGMKVTVSFRARSTIANKKIGLRLVQRYGSGGSPSVSDLLTGTVFTLTSAWQLFSFTFTTASIAGKTFGSSNDDNLDVTFGLMWGSTVGANYGTGVAETFVGAGDIEITQVMVNAGEVNLPYQPRSVPEEERLARRYCRLVGFGAIGRWNSSSIIEVSSPFGEPMRRNPLVTLKETTLTAAEVGVGNKTSAGSAVAYSSLDKNGYNIAVNGFSGGTVGSMAVLLTNAFLLDAEF